MKKKKLISAIVLFGLTLSSCERCSNKDKEKEEEEEKHNALKRSTTASSEDRKTTTPKKVKEKEKEKEKEPRQWEKIDNLIAATSKVLDKAINIMKNASSNRWGSSSSFSSSSSSSSPSSSSPSSSSSSSFSSSSSSSSSDANGTLFSDVELCMYKHGHHAHIALRTLTGVPDYISHLIEVNTAAVAYSVYVAAKVLDIKETYGRDEEYAEKNFNKVKEHAPDIPADSYYFEATNKFLKQVKDLKKDLGEFIKNNT